MKIFVICSKFFYGKVREIKSELEKLGHEVTLPNCYDASATEFQMKKKGSLDHAKFKSEMIKHSEEVIKNVDAVLVLNFQKHGSDGYIGGATFLEIYDAFRLGKLIYFYNPISESVLSDELKGFEPIIINGGLSLIK
jgi:hypothetical protein